MGAVFSVVSKIIRWGLPVVAGAVWLILATVYEDDILTKTPERGSAVWTTFFAIVFGLYAIQALIEKWGPVFWVTGFLAAVATAAALYFAFKE